jgi:hypothetical protein
LRSEEIEEMSSVKEVDLEQAQHLLERDPQPSFEPQERQDQVGDQCHPDLGHDGVLRGAQEGLDLQILFNRFEEQLDGMISNDKFCCTRWGALQLSWWRRPRRLRR